MTRGPVLLRAAVALCHDAGEAEDLLQAALTQTYLAWDRIRDRAALDGYVRQTMVRTQVSWWRRRGPEVYPTDELPEQVIDDHSGRSAQRDAVSRALARLPARQRVAVVLRYFEDMPEAEIASVLGVSVGTVKSTVSRAMAKLRDDEELRNEAADQSALPGGSGVPTGSGVTAPSGVPAASGVPAGSEMPGKSGVSCAAGAPGGAGASGGPGVPAASPSEAVPLEVCGSA